ASPSPATTARPTNASAKKGCRRHESTQGRRHQEGRGHRRGAVRGLPAVFQPGRLGWGGELRREHRRVRRELDFHVLQPPRAGGWSVVTAHLVNLPNYETWPLLRVAALLALAALLVLATLPLLTAALVGMRSIAAAERAIRTVPRLPSTSSASTVGGEHR